MPVVLVVTSDHDVIADLVVAARNERGATIVRLDPADIGGSLRFTASLTPDRSRWAGRLRTESREVALEEIDAVYWRRPSPYGFDHLPEQARSFARAEARLGLTGVLANLRGARYVGHPFAVAEAEHKAAQLITGGRLGFRVPRTLITNDLRDAQRFAADQAPVLHKPLRPLRPTSDGLAGAIWAQRVKAEALDESISVTMHHFQQEVPKVGDVRVTVVGDYVSAYRIESPGRALDWRRGDWHELVHTRIDVPEAIGERIRAYLTQLRLVFGCFDFALTGEVQDASSWVFFDLQSLRPVGLAARPRSARRRVRGPAHQGREMTDLPEHLRAKLTEKLTNAGILTDPAWGGAVSRVPRHEFLRGFYLADGTTERGLTRWMPVTPEADYDRWIHAAYTDETLITQFDGIESDWDDPQPREGGIPTSSATLPGLVVTMWQDSAIKDGHRVLEIGTGSGYSTALACERLGSALVTSIEVDRHRAAQAGSALERCGYTPTLALADGLEGYWPAAPFDRITAACSVRRIPEPWLTQLRDGGKILTTMTGWLHASSRALVTKRGTDSAEAAFLPGTISFMPARAHEAPALGRLPEQADGVNKAADPEPAAFLTDWTMRWIAQLAAPEAVNIGLGMRDGTTMQVLSDPHTGATVWFHQGYVTEHKPYGMWRRITTALEDWRAAGSPRQTEFRLRIEGGRQVVTHPRMATAFVLP